VNPINFLESYLCESYRSMTYSRGFLAYIREFV